MITGAFSVSDEYIAPTYGLRLFTCPHCGHRTGHTWFSAGVLVRGTGAVISVCQSCDGVAVWAGVVATFGAGWVEPTYNQVHLQNDARLVHPPTKVGPRPHESMPEDVREDYGTCQGL
jgi:hypothetical protein